MADELKIDRHGRVTVLTLNRPERRNALTMALAADFEAAVEEFDQDSSQRVLVVTGAGEKAFCSGADLAEVQDKADAGTKLPVAPDQDMLGIGRCDKPVICAINGLAVGAGLELAICCDYRLAADHAWFGLPEVERGFIAGVAAVTLPRLMPIGAVMELMLLGERMPAAEAHRLGLVQKVYPAADLMANAMEQAERMSRYSPSALWGTKQVIRHWRNRSIMDHHDYYKHVVNRVFASGDIAEGLQAFMEKRAPEFSQEWPPRPSLTPKG